MLFNKSSPKDMFIDSREEGTEGQRERQTDINVREKHRLVTFHMYPDWYRMMLQAIEQPSQGCAF